MMGEREKREREGFGSNYRKEISMGDDVRMVSNDGVNDGGMMDHTTRHG